MSVRYVTDKGEHGEVSVSTMFHSFAFVAFDINVSTTCPHKYLYALLNPSEELMEEWNNRTQHIFFTSEKSPSEMTIQDIGTICTCDVCAPGGGYNNSNCDMAYDKRYNALQSFSIRIKKLFREKPSEFEYVLPKFRTWCRNCSLDRSQCHINGPNCMSCKRIVFDKGRPDRRKTIRVTFQHTYTVIPDVRVSLTPIQKTNLSCEIEELTKAYVVFRLTPNEIQKDVEGVLTYHIQGPIEGEDVRAKRNGQEETVSDPS
jgi:hypothetical protein